MPAAVAMTTRTDVVPTAMIAVASSTSRSVNPRETRLSILVLILHLVSLPVAAAARLCAELVAVRIAERSDVVLLHERLAVVDHGTRAVHRRDRVARAA